MKTDFSVSFCVPYGTTETQVTVHAVSTIAAAILTYYFGELQRHDQEDTAEMTLKEFSNFKDYCKRAAANKFDFIFTIT